MPKRTIGILKLVRHPLDNELTVNKQVAVLIALIGIGLSGIFVLYGLNKSMNVGRSGSTGNSSSSNSTTEPRGAAMADVPWKHFPNVSNFEFTDQNGKVFNSEALAGKPYAVSFFFASCPTICKDLNRTIDRVNRQLRGEDITFVSISVDPENDTPEVLNRYAADFNAAPDRWAFLTGPAYRVSQLGEHQFRVVVNKDTHTDNILLVDRWGRYRDRFKWDDPFDMKRFVEVVKTVASETEPPIDQSFRTRNVLAGIAPPELKAVPWIRDFHLTERSGAKFHSGDMTGKVWIANFFFTTCPGICKRQNAYLSGLQDRLVNHPTTIVSITTDPKTDDVAKLGSYANEFGADRERWLFCTGNETLIRRVSSEFFGAHATGDHHSSMLFLVDRWGNVRGEFDWQDAQEEVELIKTIDALNAEKYPPARFQKRKP